tara:strand:- start:293 stop:586 length:294 start_codon:yes stop_codon:yes gene_type:complete
MKIDKVLNIDIEETVPVGDEELTLYEAARWVTLIDGMQAIEKHANMLKIDLVKGKNLIKPLALQKYIDEATPGKIAEIKNLKDHNSPVPKGYVCTTL